MKLCAVVFLPLEVAFDDLTPETLDIVFWENLNEPDICLRLIFSVLVDQELLGS